MKKLEIYKNKNSFPIAGREFILYLDEDAMKVYKWVKNADGTYTYEVEADSSFVGPHPQHPPK